MIRAARALASRRAIQTIFIVLILAAGGGLSAAAQDTSWNGTWIGNWQNGRGAQIIFAGNEFIGIYWGDDYVDDAVASVSADGKVVTISWAGTKALLTRDGNEAADIVIHRTGQPDVSFLLTRDHS
jgi:hypothetical protein